MSEERIAKIKMKEGQIIIVLSEKQDDQNERETTLKSYDAAHQDFLTSIDALCTHARSILDLPHDWKRDEMRITGVSFSMSETTGVEGAVISGQVSLTGADAPFNFNTPHLPFESYSETSNGPVMPEDAQTAISRVADEAMKFIKGKRAQGDMFAEAAA